MGSGGGGDTTQINEPWSGLKPYVEDFYRASTDWYNRQAPQQYPGQRVAGLTEQQQDALNQQQNMAIGALPGQINAVQQPFFQNLNPYANPMMGQVGGMMGSANTALSGILGQPYYPTPTQQAPNVPGVAGWEGPAYTPPETIGPAPQDRPEIDISEPDDGRIPQVPPDPDPGDAIRDNPAHPGLSAQGGPGPTMGIMPVGGGQSINNPLPQGQGGMVSGQAVLPGATGGDLQDPTGGIYGPSATSPAPPSIPTGYNVPQIGFNPQMQRINPQQFTPNVDPTLGAPSPTGSLEQMMSGTPNMDVWEPVMDAATRGTIEQFNREVLPGITEQEIGSGQWGSSRADIARGVAAGDVGEAIADARARLGQQAASEALQQRSTGTGLAAQLRQAGGQLGLGAAELGGRLGTSQAQLGQATQELGANLAGQQAQLGLSTNQLNEAQRASMAGERINAADIQMGAAQDIYGNLMNNYSRQLGLAPGIMEMGMTPANVMSQVGDVYQQQDQRYIDDAMQQWNYEQQLPLNMLLQYRDLLNAPGSSAQSSFMQGPEPNQTASTLGGGLSGAGTGAMVGSQIGSGYPGWGTLIGGLIGAGMGYYGSQ